MKNVNEIKCGFIGAMEYGAMIEKKKDGSGKVEYQGNSYSATKEQVDYAIKLPQVKHMRLGLYLIPKKWRKPFGDSRFWIKHNGKI